mmetsp:Transcript_11037/g.25543  ORF Transcript_11037/g.25543 Transcript_11037/m.25543 type:complete len:279 (-) Transcript_11037:292-1128(-)
MVLLTLSPLSSLSHAADVIVLHFAGYYFNGNAGTISMSRGFDLRSADPGRRARAKTSRSESHLSRGLCDSSSIVVVTGHTFGSTAVLSFADKVAAREERRDWRRAGRPSNCACSCTTCLRDRCTSSLSSFASRRNACMDAWLFNSSSRSFPTTLSLNVCCSFSSLRSRESSTLSADSGTACCQLPSPHLSLCAAHCSHCSHTSRSPLLAASSVSAFTSFPFSGRTSTRQRKSSSPTVDMRARDSALEPRSSSPSPRSYHRRVHTSRSRTTYFRPRHGR